MQIGHIVRLIFKDTFGMASVGEKAELEEWMGQSHANRDLYNKLHEPSFIEKAITDNNTMPRKSVWKRILQGTKFRKTAVPVTKLRKTEVHETQGFTAERISAVPAAVFGAKSLKFFRLPRRMMRVAAILAIPVAVGIGLLAFGLFSPSREKNLGALLLISPGSPKVVVTLPNGEEMLFRDNQSVSLDKDGHTVVSEENTVSLTAKEATPNREQFISYKIPSGGEYTVKLDDGTIITMNSESKLQAPIEFGQDQRIVHFEGEGYFNVAHDPKRKFVVKTKRAEFLVHGTEFNITAYNSEVETVVTLVCGTVSLRSDAVQQVTMVPGTQARVLDNGDVAVETVDIYPYTAWKSGRIVFENARTEDIMNVLKRWYNCEVYYGDEVVKERRFTMDILKYDEFTEVLDLMKKVKVRYEIKGNEIYLYSK